jgi:nucleoside-diphosphate-sugar epimerase
MIMETFNLRDMIVKKSSSIEEAMKAIDKNSFGMAIIVDNENHFYGLVTDGDIRRAILKGVGTSAEVSSIANTKATTIEKENLFRIAELSKDAEILAKLPIDGSLKIPVLDKDKKVVDLHLFSPTENKSRSFSNSPPRPVKKILVTGGAGYVGAVLVRKLLSLGYSVRVIDNLTYGDEGISELRDKPGFEFIEADILNLRTIVNSMKGVDAVIHLADIVGDPACAIDPQITIENNFLAGKSIAEAARYFQVNRFIFASSCSVYGYVPEGVANENTPQNPVSLYARIKYDLERGIMSLAKENFCPTGLRLSTVYGYSPRMRFDLVANIMIAKAIHEKKIMVYGGSQFRPLVHVSDVADAFITILQAPIEKVRAQVFNVGSNEQNFRILELGKQIQSLIEGTELEVITTKEDDRSYAVSFEKINKELGFKARKSLKDAAEEIQEAFRRGDVSDYTDKKYSDYMFIKERLKDIPSDN